MRKRVQAIAAVSFCTVVGLVGLVLLLPSDVVTSRYASIAAARADNLFDRGWLPDILPPSANAIRTSNDLDLNTSEGEFSFVPSDYSFLASRFQQSTAANTPFANFEKRVARMQNKGFLLGTYAEEKTTWVFFCKPEKGYCEYTMWLSRGSAGGENRSV